LTKQEETQVYIVATPIGNKADFSQRAINVLKEVDIIACEDSRTSANLLNDYSINTKLISYHKFNEKQRTTEFLNLLKEGKKIALISDAGTPCISDPGRILVQELFENNIKITSIPGASAITTFISMIPRSLEEFAFVGFLPRIKNQQAKIFDKYANTDLVFYESPIRLIETLENIKLHRGISTKIAIGRELTKKFEEVKVDTIENIIEYYSNNTLKGEIACMLYADKNKNENNIEILNHIKKLQELNYTNKDISQILSILFNQNKNNIYKLIINSKK